MELTNEKYLDHKNSGIKWVDKIPLHWQSKPFFTIGKVISEINCQDNELLSVYLDRGVIKFSDVTEKRTNVTSEDLSKYQAVKPGNLVLNNQQAWRGSVGVSKYYGIVSPAYIVLSLSKDFDHDFANYLFRDSTMVSHYLVCSKGVGTIQRNLYWPQLKRVNVMIPPLQEQTAIAEFLDRKTALIDQAIDIKQKQIELLKERRQILIHKAVTRGLNPNVKMKDSGVEWIGEIPEYWELKRFKFLCDITTGSKNTEDKVEDGLYPFYVRSQTPERINSYSFEGEAILTAGDGAGVGKVFHYLNEKFDFHQRVYKFSDFQNIKGKLLFYFLQNNFHNVALNGEAKSTVDSLRLPLIQNFPVPLPSDYEQTQIIEHIENITSKIAIAISLKEQEIEKLKEYKATLINSAVTGKIKVYHDAE
jgi:type I restriction enzyme S subunit